MKMVVLGKQVLLAALLGSILAAPGFGQQAPEKAAPATPASKASAATAAAKSTPATPAAPAEDPKKVVMKVGTQSFTQADMEYLISSLSPQIQKAVAVQGKKPLGEQYAVMAALSQQAEKDRLDASELLRQELAFQRLQALAQAEYQKMSTEIKVSPDEINAYYTGHPTEFEEAQVREVVIRKKAEGAKDDTPGLSATDAHSRADEIRKALTAGTDPKKVAEQFAVENSIQIDAEPRAVRHGELIPTLDQAAFNLKEGALSDPFENAQALAFLQVVGHKRQELKDVTENIGNTLHDQKLQAAVDDLKKKTTVWMDEQYFKPPAEPAPPAVQGSEPK
ncbi:MAG TPA: peptidylprolyl isomerase [Terriglobia bacterium]|nr:peptidylprolyl isomerase [Terriglobia bacterium]